LSIRLVNPFIAGSVPAIGFLPETLAYVAAVESADGQSLEDSVIVAIDAFIVGCKADGIWTAIKSCCILAGARTLGGALIPLIGTAPTNISGLFLEGDYSRETGLLGDGSTKALNANRNNNADPQDNKHLSVFVSAATSGTQAYISQGTIAWIVKDNSSMFFRANQTSSGSVSLPNATGLIGVSRSGAASVSYRAGGTTTTATTASAATVGDPINVFRMPNASLYSSGRLAFYSIGESLDLALLDSRVSTLIAAIGAAIP